MDMILTKLQGLNPLVVFFSNDEIVMDVNGVRDSLIHPAIMKIKNSLKHINIPLKVEYFKLHKIEGTNGYYKEVFQENGEKLIKFKCLDSLYLPFVIRHFLGEEVQDSDKVFYHNGLLARFIEVPEIEVSLNGD
jgi:hypothetical protein